MIKKVSNNTEDIIKKEKERAKLIKTHTMTNAKMRKTNKDESKDKNDTGRLDNDLQPPGTQEPHTSIFTPLSHRVSLTAFVETLCHVS